MKLMNQKMKRMLVAVAAIAQLSGGCQSKDERAAKFSMDSMTEARARGEHDLKNPEMGAKVLITLSEYKVESTHTEIPKGQVTFAVVNKGTIPHEFEITGKSGDWRSMPIAAGGNILMSMLLDPGTYDLYSPSKDGVGATDRSKGMEGKITVK